MHVTEATEATAAMVSSLCLFAEDGVAPRATTVSALVGDVVDHFELRNGKWERPDLLHPPGTRTPNRTPIDGTRTQHTNTVPAIPAAAIR